MTFGQRPKVIPDGAQRRSGIELIKGAHRGGRSRVKPGMTQQRRFRTEPADVPPP